MQGVSRSQPVGAGVQKSGSGLKMARQDGDGYQRFPLQPMKKRQGPRPLWGREMPSSVFQCQGGRNFRRGPVADVKLGAGLIVEPLMDARGGRFDS